uniref:Uncharacterized protein n=1 Tax=Anguilla anguilla TaxID=7936 RepID=A0A0E9R509_ANGAN
MLSVLHKIHFGFYTLIPSLYCWYH